MRVLVTGAEGFVGSRLVPRLIERGHVVVAGVREGHPAVDHLEGAEVVRPFDLEDPAKVAGLAEEAVDAVIHLAAWSSGDTGPDPGRPYAVNAGGTARLAEAVARAAGGRRRRFLHVSSGMVYRAGHGVPLRESDPVEPRGAYAGSKLASETAVFDVQRRTGLEVVVARPFNHAGAGQDERFVVPAFARRIREAHRVGAVAIGVGNLEPIRDILHVADVVEAYVALLEGGRPGEIYNVASGTGISVRDLFLLVADTIGCRLVPEVDTAYVRRDDPIYLVGDASKLRTEMDWAPRRTLAEAVREVVDAASK